MRRNFCWIAIIFIFVLVSSCCGQTAEELAFKSSVDKNKLSQNETLTLKVEISGALKGSPEIKLPDLKNDFEILSSGQSQSISISTQEKKQTTVFEFVLAPKKAGRITMGQVEVKYSGKSYKTAPIEIEVTASKPSPAAPPSPKPEEGLPENSGEATII